MAAPATTFLSNDCAKKYNFVFAISIGMVMQHFRIQNSEFRPQGDSWI